jgi:hypothetical protein
VLHRDLAQERLSFSVYTCDLIQSTVATMRSFSGLPVLIVAAIGTAVAQYNDGYETVDSATDPVQIRLAYQGPTAMMGK